MASVFRSSAATPAHTIVDKGKWLMMMMMMMMIDGDTPSDHISLSVTIYMVVPRERQQPQPLCLQCSSFAPSNIFVILEQ